uniref:collagenase n=1 Tax=Streptomyces sp. GSL17-111 TaxID=3121596 RepID=UPI0030F4A2CE
MLSAPAYAAPRPTDRAAPQQTAGDLPPRASAEAGEADPEHVRGEPLKAADRPPLPSTADALRRDYDDPSAPAPRPRPSLQAEPGAPVADCRVSDFTGRTGDALVRQVKASTTACVNSLFGLTGSDAHHAFREGQMVSVATALRAASASYPGDSSTGVAQLVLYLRAGYYVHWYHEADTGPYGPALRTAVRAGLDAFFAAPRSRDVTDANGEVLAEAVTLIDSAEENARYLHVVERLLKDYDSTYDASFWMLTAVNNVHTVLFRGHQLPAFVAEVSSDPEVLDVLYDFASTHRDLLGTERGYLTSNAGRELARFLRHDATRSTVRPQAVRLLELSSLTGVTAPLWVGVAEMADSYDRTHCGAYGTCDLRQRLREEVLVVDHTCGDTLRVRAQQMTSEQLADTCRDLAGQDAHFHAVAGDDGPVPGDRNTSLEVVVYDSSTDYRTYAGATWGIDTDNGGMYLEGDPSAAGNQARFIAYEAEWVRPSFAVWNLNHEYTHYLDGRFNLHGGFADNVATPTVWWIEGFAEYVSYSYRDLRYDAALTEAGKGTYALSTLFDTTYAHDAARVYRWGYLAVRYMLQSHRAEVDTVLGHYRSGDWDAARSHLTDTIGTRHDADWRRWLSRCASGECGGPTNPPDNRAPTAAFTVAVSALTADFTDGSTDPDGTIASHAWDFGDGTASTAANPTKTYPAAGTYPVTLTVTDDRGATDTATRSVVVGEGGAVPECTAADTRRLDRDCRRGDLAATEGNHAYLYLYLPADTQQLVITASGGTGDADLYYSDTSWATTTAYTSRSTGPGNTETITVTDPAPGWHYVSLAAAEDFAGVAVTAAY